MPKLTDTQTIVLSRAASRPGNLPAVTGASGRRILGTVFPA